MELTGTEVISRTAIPTDQPLLWSTFGFPGLHPESPKIGKMLAVRTLYVTISDSHFWCPRAQPALVGDRFDTILEHLREPMSVLT